MNGLTESSIDIPLATLNQTPAEHSGPLGRLKTIKNMQVTHYTPTDGGPTKLKAEPRGALIALSNTTRNPKTGNISAVPFDNPELFSSLDNEPLSICNAVPRVRDGDSWIAYEDKRVVTNTLEVDVFHTSDRTIQAQDFAIKSGVKCEVWCERKTPANDTVVLMIGFKSADGAWIRTPAVLYEPTLMDPTLTMARVVPDQAANYFWIIHNYLTGGNNFFKAHLFDLHGVEIDTDGTQSKFWLTEPGYWDVTQREGGGALLVQPSSTNPTDGDGVFITRYTQSAGNISAAGLADNAVHCRGPLAWISNVVDTNRYLATVGLGEGPGGKLWGYQFRGDGGLSHDHEYNYALEIPGAGYPDSLIGYTVPNLNVDNTGFFPDMIVSFTVLPLTAASEGPAFDPALRYSKVYSCDFADTVTFIRQNNSTCQVSRAFQHDGEWYAITYYQSGSGLVVTQDPINVTWTDGDYMIGAAVQPINILAGADNTHGSAKTLTSGTSDIVYVSTAVPAQNIDDTGTPDSVAQFVASGIPGVPDGGVLYRWTFKNLTDTTLTPGGRLKIIGSSIASANTEWSFLYSESAHVFVTLPVSIINTQILSFGNFVGSGGAGGTAELVSMTTYTLDSLDTVYDGDTRFFLFGGTIVVTGSGSADGTFTIAEAKTTVGSGNITFAKGIRVVTTTQTSSISPFTAVLTPVLVQDWLFGSMTFDEALIAAPHKLDVKGCSHPDNDLEYNITDGADAIITTDGGNIIAEYFRPPLPTITIRVPLDEDTYKFKLQSLTLDYTFNDALVFVQDANNVENNGLYKISFIDLAANTFIAQPADGRTGQRSELFPSDVTITIFLQNAVQPVFQPKWFIEPLFDCDTAHIGRFEDGLAFADWRFEGAANGINDFSLHVTSVQVVSDGKEFTLPYRARSFTAGQPLVAPPNSVAEAAVTIFESTVGIKHFSLKTKCGVAAPQVNELFIPGPLTSVFTSSGFREQGISVAPEAPYIVSQSTESDDIHQTPGTTHQLVVTYEVTDENGNRIYCPPSPPLDYKLTGTNNSIVYGGRLPIPFDTTGKQIAKHYGVTNHKLIGITLQRTSYRGGLPTIQHFKITDDLNVNGLAPVSDINPSGFSFPDEFTWHYKDQNPDINILSSEILYTDKGYLPRFPAPPSRFSTTWLGRPWVVAYDGSVQCGGEFAEGDAPWMFPGFRFTFGNDKAIACAPMGNYLVVGCENSMWYIPQPGSLPDASGRNGTLPTPIQLDKIKSGCTGFMLPVDGGVAYSSTVGGAWLITTNFQNVYMSRDVQDILRTATITAMQLDSSNRLHIAFGDNQLVTYDQIVGTWYNWEFDDASNATLLSVIDGQIAFQDETEVVKYDPSSFVDFMNEISQPILWRIVFADFNFGGVRRFKHCWAFQILGEYLGPHRLWAKIGYPDDNYEPVTTLGPFVPNNTDPYLVEANPMLEDASTFSLELYNDFVDVLSPGQSATIELVSAAVGLEIGQAQTTRRLT